MKSIRFLFFIILSICLLSACGGGGDDGGGGIVIPPVVPTGGPVNVSGDVFFTDGVTPVQGATITVSVTTQDELDELRASIRSRYFDYTKPGPTGEKGVGASRAADPITVALQDETTTTDGEGKYSVTIDAPSFPVRVLVTINYQQTGYPSVDTSVWSDADASGDLTIPQALIPDPAQTEIAIGSGGEAQSSDGKIELSNLPASIDRVFGQNFDPETDSQSFPGEFAEMGQIPLNSSNFLWMEALDANGNPVTDLSQAVTIRSLVPTTQWSDLEDIVPGTDRIEIPIYTFDEITNFWTQESANGWLEDSARTVLPEDAQSVILNGTFSGNIFAVFNISHLSWMNVDYAYLGPWTLSRLSSSKRNNDCLYKATKLAQTIFRTSWGNTAYADVNKSGVNINEEVKDRGASELKDATLSDKTFGQTTSSDFKELLYLNSKLWDTCDSKKKETIFAMAVTILHETAHWKHDVKKYDGVYSDEGDVGGEAGLRIEKNLFGESIWTKDGKLPVTSLRTGSNKDITTDQLNKLTDPSWWTRNESSFSAAFWQTFWGGGSDSYGGSRAASPITVTLEAAQTQYELGGSVPINVTYENTSSAAVQVLNLNILQGYPLYFEVKDSNGQTLNFAGDKIKGGVGESDYVDLAAGATMQFTVDLAADGDGNTYFNFTAGGDYTVTAYYTGYFGLPEAVSNTITITFTHGGSINGTVSDASTGAALTGATVQALVNDNVIASAVTDDQGEYLIPEVPAGTYTLLARADGYLRSQVTGFVVTAEQAFVQNFSLSPLLSEGELRIVLTWSESPSDLDSHLWLPAEIPYHIYYGRLGNAEACPFASLDLDDTSSYGPETVTISQRYLTGEYVYAVYNFSGSPAITSSQAQVNVYDSSGLLVTYDIPTEGTGLWWHVFNVNGETGAITEVNQILETNPEPYADTDAGCVQE